MIRRMNEDEIEARKMRGLHICIMSCNTMSYPPPPPTHTLTRIDTHTYLHACMHIQTYQKNVSPPHLNRRKISIISWYQPGRYLPN